MWKTGGKLVENVNISDQKPVGQAKPGRSYSPKILYSAGEYPPGRDYFKMSSPIFTTSPAPMVISRSPDLQFSFRNASISAKLG